MQLLQGIIATHQHALPARECSGWGSC